jgi:esterase/lipase superfamily enzyme
MVSLNVNDRQVDMNQPWLTRPSGNRLRSLQLLGLVVMTLALLTACAGTPPNQINLMPAPGVYTDAGLAPFSDDDDIPNVPYEGMLYVTDRLPTDDQKKIYLDDRGAELRVGVASIELAGKTMTWEEARRISLLKNRADDYPLQVKSVKEFGILDRSFSDFTPAELVPPDRRLASQQFIDNIQQKLAVSERKDIYIYVHGYKVPFENPLLVATELWHFMGYDGVMIAFSWPSTPSTLAYMADLETAALSAFNLRLLLEFLAEETPARRIHIVGYSAGTRLVLDALAQLAFVYTDEDPAHTRRKTRLGRVILVGSDVDRHLFAAYLVEGLLKVSETLTIYQSGTDKALGVSKWVFGRKRLGQFVGSEMDPSAVDYLRRATNLHLINVTGTEGAATGNGHAYFRKSPWTSSDIFATLLYDLDPPQRGLVRDEETAIWTFPEDYISRLKSGLDRVSQDATQ